MQETMAALQNSPPGPMKRTARELLASELRREGMQKIGGPLSVATLPGAARAFGWASECVYGARVSVAQLALLSGWPGSAASMATAILMVLPLLQIHPLAVLLHSLLGPAAAIFGAACALADDVVVLLAATAASVCFFVKSAICLAPLHMSDVVAAGPQSVLLLQSRIHASPAATIVCSALSVCAWTPLKEEILFRYLLQVWTIA